MLGYAWDGSLRVGDEPPLFCLFVLVGWVCLVIYLSVFMAFSLEECPDGLNILTWCHILSVMSADLSWIRCWSSCTRLSNVTFADDASDGWQKCLDVIIVTEKKMSKMQVKRACALKQDLRWEWKQHWIMRHHGIFFSLRSLHNYSTFNSSPFDWSLKALLISDWLSFILAC